jgi:hypothetical protein
VVLLPQNYNMLNEIHTRDYISFLHSLSEVTEFWNFSTYSSIALDNSNFYDSQHFRAFVGDDLVDKMFSRSGMKDGVYVTSQNKFSHIDTIRKQFEWADEKWK